MTTVTVTRTDALDELDRLRGEGGRLAREYVEAAARARVHDALHDLSSWVVRLGLAAGGLWTAGMVPEPDEGLRRLAGSVGRTSLAGWTRPGRGPVAAGDAACARGAGGWVGRARACGVGRVRR
jgi:hypothetical protein